MKQLYLKLRNTHKADYIKILYGYAVSQGFKYSIQHFELFLMRWVVPKQWYHVGYEYFEAYVISIIQILDIFYEVRTVEINNTTLYYY